MTATKPMTVRTMTVRTRRTTMRIAWVMFACIAFLFTEASAADKVADFYKGKRITMLVQYSPGGTFDIRARWMARHMPAVTGARTIVRNLPGGGGVAGYNRLSQLPPDGLSLLTAHTKLVAFDLFRNKGVRYDYEKFGYLGRVIRTNTALLVRKDLPSDIEGLRKLKRIRIGASSPFNEGMIAEMFGLPITIVPGYGGSAERMAAIMRGELDATTAAVATGLKFKKAVKHRVYVRQGQAHTGCAFPGGTGRQGALAELCAFVLGDLRHRRHLSGSTRGQAAVSERGPQEDHRHQGGSKGGRQAAAGGGVDESGGAQEDPEAVPGAQCRDHEATQARHRTQVRRQAQVGANTNGAECMEIKFGLISADSHCGFDRDAFTSRMSADKWGQRIPQVKEVEEDGRKVHRWCVYGKPRGDNVGNCPALMGDPFPTYPQRWEDVPALGYDPHQRLKALDEDGIDAEVLFPNPSGRHVLRVGRPGVRAGRSACLQRRPGGMDHGQRPLLPGNHHSVPERPHDHPARDRTGHHGRSPGHQPARRGPPAPCPTSPIRTGIRCGTRARAWKCQCISTAPAASWRAGPPASGAATPRGRPTRP